MSFYNVDSMVRAVDDAKDIQKLVQRYIELYREHYGDDRIMAGDILVMPMKVAGTAEDPAVEVLIFSTRSYTV